MRGRVAVTSIVRHVPSGLNSGLLRVIELESRQVLVTSVVPESTHRRHDQNPRGGLRGARGVSFLEDRFLVANSERVFVFDRSWTMVDELSHPWTADIHEVMAEPDGAWITCTACDLLLKLDWSGRVLDVWHWRSDRDLVTQFALRPLRSFDPTIDYRDPRQRGREVHDVAHLNAVARGPAGLLVSLGRVLSPAAYRSRRLKGVLEAAADATVVARPAVAALRRRHLRNMRAIPLPMPDMAHGSSALVLLRDGEEACGGARSSVVVRADGLRFPNHNVVHAGGMLVYNDSNTGRVVAFDRGGTGVRRSVVVPGKPSYARGLAWLEDASFLVGSQRPTAVHAVDLKEERVTASMVLGTDPMESVSSLAVVPDAFEDPPVRLRFRRSAG